MKKHKIVVADSSYTIRRILELSFEDEEQIEIHTFESGEGLTDKLVELRPSVVITDIKLPFKSGYDICAFINQNDQLKEAKVFLMRGGFEAVDDEKLASLKYQEIISKPFDSTEVIEKIKECLFPAEKELKAEPGAAPDDIPHRSPSSLASLRVMLPASSLVTFMISSTRSRRNISGIKPAPIPCIL